MISFKSLIFQFVIGPLLKGKATFKSTIVGEKNDPKNLEKLAIHFLQLSAF